MQVGSEPVHAFAKKIKHQFAFTVPPDAKGPDPRASPRAVHQPLGRETLQGVIRAFASRLVDKTAWSCETCGTISTAPVLVGDGTGIAPPRALSCEPVVREFAEHEHTKFGSAHANRVLLPDARARNLVYGFCGRAITKGAAIPAFSSTACCCAVSLL